MNLRLPSAAVLLVALLCHFNSGLGQETPGAVAFQRLDKNKDSIVTETELAALWKRN